MRRTIAAILVSGVVVASTTLTTGQEPPKNWVPIQQPGTPVSAPETTAHLQYYGGPVISNVMTVSVLWGSGVDAQVAAAMPAFLRDVTNSSYMDWLCEYNTLGLSGTTTNQVIGRGSYTGQYTITPQHTGTTLADQDIQDEIAYQLQQGNLPQPQYDAQGYPETLYLIEFPPGITILAPGGAQSCVYFCAYHGTMMYSGKPLMYSIHPDYGGSSGCAGGCGSGTMLQNQESAHSHQLIEAVTDPDVGLANPVLGWYDPQGSNGEIGDICNAQSATVTVNGAAYTVQKEWSNRLNACVAGNANLAAPPSIGGSASVPVGGTIALTASGGTAPYEWIFVQGNGEQVIPGQTADTLTITPATLQDSGAFRVFSKGSCTAESAPWPVKVCPVIALSPSPLPAPAIGIPYNQTITAAGGTAPYSFSVFVGSLPPGLSLSSTGVLSGTLASASAYSFTIAATDATGCTGTRAYTLQAVDPPVITLMKKVAPPLKFVLTGSNLQKGIRVYIEGVQWTSVVWKKSTKVLLTGGAALKTAVPKGASKTFSFVNPDGGEASMTWSW